MNVFRKAHLAWSKKFHLQACSELLFWQICFMYSGNQGTLFPDKTGLSSLLVHKGFEFGQFNTLSPPEFSLHFHFNVKVVRYWNWKQKWMLSLPVLLFLKYNAGVTGIVTLSLWNENNFCIGLSGLFFYIM